jgi:serine/threonine-protein kinase
MPEFPRMGSLPDDDNESLAHLERIAESGLQPAPATSSGTEGRIFEAVAEHYRLYNLIDQLASPVRLALGVDEFPPQLPEYESLEEIGRGGMGVVYRGLHRKLRRMDAIKVIRPDRFWSDSPESIREMQSRFERELRLAAYIAHENIVPVYQVGEENGRLWFSMQLVEGISLQELRGHAATATEQIVSVLEKIARAVDRLHRHGVIHGDIKPHNILIEQHSGRPLITDFGLAEFNQCFDLHGAETRDGAAIDGIAGTPAYMAPELLHAAMSQTSSQDANFVRSVSSDIYSLGATLWATLTGRSPLELKETQRAMHFASTSLPPGLLEICQKSMSLDPASRHQSARELADDLAQWLNRPRWNRHFPGLRNLLWMIVAPWMIASSIIVWFMLRENAGEVWIWSMILSNYAPLFVAFFIGQKRNRESHTARRELWSIWIGHAFGTVAGLIGLRIHLGANPGQTVPAFYCLWAAISAVALFAKSGNFWAAYRWIGICWCVVAIAIVLMPGSSSILFGCCAALTCLVIARGDKAFAEAD